MNKNKQNLLKLIDLASKKLGRPVRRDEFFRYLKIFFSSGIFSSLFSSLPNSLFAEEVATQAKDLKEKIPLKYAKKFRERYFDKISFDDVSVSTHNLNCWFQQNCNFHVFTKNGKVVREEQVADYPQTNEHVPDHNPRGCQKGCSYNEVMYNDARVLHPLKRSGKRGEGKWQRVSWDEALDDIADKIISSIKEHGTRSIVVDPGGTGMVSHTTFYSLFRFFEYIDAILLDINCELGDDQQGAAVTYGEIAGDRSGDDYFYSDLIFIWGGNPAFTQIPNFHYISEARYNGAKIISICPDLNASAIHADLWFPIKPSTDAALANAMAHVIIKEKLFDKKLIQEQSDLTYLVRSDNSKLLRESDIKEGGSKETTYRWNVKTNKLEEPSLSDLALYDSNPALTGKFRVRTKDGYIEVRPSFDLLIKRLEKFTPEYTSKICGISADNIRLLARELAKAKAATNVCTSAMSKFYHGDIMMRSMILVFILCGHLGKKGAGFVSTSFLVADGSNKIILESEIAKEKRLDYALEHGGDFWKTYFSRGSYEQATYRYTMDVFNDSEIFTNSTLYWAVHADLLENAGRSNEWDKDLKRPLHEYLEPVLESVFHVHEDIPPKVFFAIGGNILRRLRGSQKMITELWPKLDLVVSLDMRYSTTSLYSDYILPVSSAYEKSTSLIANSNSIIPYLHTTNKVVENVGQSKDEWEILTLLAKKIQEKAKKMDDSSFKTRFDKERYFDRMYDFLTFNFDENEHEKITEDFINSSSNLDDNWDDMKEKGYSRINSLGDAVSNWGNATDIKKGETITPYTWHTEKKEPWFTLTGRIQFYIDHDTYLELGEEFPIHKDAPISGGNYPLFLSGGHTRWSIHAQWRADPKLLQLQRGEPIMLISKKDAKKKKIKDHQRIEIFNDVGSFITRAKISASVQPGQVIMYHAWENYQFENWQGYRNVLASPLNPIEMAADGVFMRPILAQRQPGQSDRDTRINFKKAKHA